MKIMMGMSFEFNAAISQQSITNNFWFYPCELRFITRHEFKKALQHYGLSVLMAEEVDEMFDNIDANGDGVLEHLELEEYLKNVWGRYLEDTTSHASDDVRRQYTQNRALQARAKKRKEAIDIRQQLANARAARERKTKQPRAIAGQSMIAANASNSPEDRVQQYLLEMRTKQDEKWRSMQSRGM
jgi:Ca2+-binding EF-hand superfamily protein